MDKKDVIMGALIAGAIAGSADVVAHEPHAHQETPETVSYS